MKSILIALIAPLLLTLPGCARPDLSPPVAATADTALLKAAEALYVAEIVYQNAAEAALFAIDIGLIGPAAAGDARDLNAQAYAALEGARSAVDAAERLRSAQAAIGFANRLLTLAKGVAR